MIQLRNGDNKERGGQKMKWVEQFIIWIIYCLLFSGCGHELLDQTASLMIKNQANTNNLEIFLKNEQRQISGIDFISDTTLLVGVDNGEGYLLYDCAQDKVTAYKETKPYALQRQQLLERPAVIADPSGKAIAVYDAAGTEIERLPATEIDLQNAAQLSQRVAVSADGQMILWVDDAQACCFTVMDRDTGEEKQFTIDVPFSLQQEDLLQMLPDAMYAESSQFHQISFLQDGYVGLHFWLTGKQPIAGLHVIYHIATGEIACCQVGDFYFYPGVPGQVFVLSNLSMINALQTQEHAVYRLDLRQQSIPFEPIAGLQAQGMALSSNGQFVATVMEQGDRIMVSVLNTNDLKQDWQFAIEKTESLQGYYDAMMAISPDGKTVAVVDAKKTNCKLYQMPCE